MLNELELRRAKDSRLALLNLQAVGVLGHSLGGYTALAIGGANLTRLGLASACDGSVEEQPILNLSLLLQCRFLELPQGLPDLRDNRVQAVLAINPLTSHLFGPTGIEQLDVPTLLVASTDDYFVPPLPEQIEPFNWMTMTDKYLLVIHNGTHFTPLDAGEEIFPVPDFLLGADQSLAQPVLQAQTLAFFQRYLLNQAEVENYLSRSYLERFNSDAFTYSIQRGYSRSDRDLRLHP